MSSRVRKEAFLSLIPYKKDPITFSATATAPINIALIKYWGKRDSSLNLPMTDSISIALDRFTTTTVSQGDSSLGEDLIISDGVQCSSSSSFHKRIVEFLSHIRPTKTFFFKIETKNDVPTGSGLASSASGFCALAKALDLFFGWNLSEEKISVLARLGSGSACRSVFPGLVQWKKGALVDGSDSFAEPLPYIFPEMRVALQLISEAEKPISSRDAMNHTVASSPLYAAWPKIVEQHTKEFFSLVQKPEIDFFQMFSLFEQNALAMHATMAASRPAVLYWMEGTIQLLRALFQFRERNPSIPLFCTMDAGPNVKLLFLKRDQEIIQTAFPAVTILSPIWDSSY